MMSLLSFIILFFNFPPVSIYHKNIIDIQRSKNGKIKGPNKKPSSIKSNAILEKDLTMTASIDLMLANDVLEAIEVSKNHVAPIQNLMLVDKANIAMQLIGKIPKRRSSHETQGRYLSNGWETKNQWDGFFSATE